MDASPTFTGEAYGMCTVQDAMFVICTLSLSYHMMSSARDVEFEAGYFQCWDYESKLRLFI